MDADAETDLSCPLCQSPMEGRSVGGGAEAQVCPDGHGVFLRKADLGALVEAEQDWHRHAGQHTMPMPRITADMEAPPGGKTQSRAWVETLF